MRKIKVSVVKDNDALQFEKFKKAEQDIFNVQRSRRWVEETDFKATEKAGSKSRGVFRKTSWYIWILLQYARMAF